MRGTLGNMAGGGGGLSSSHIATLVAEKLLPPNCVATPIVAPVTPPTALVAAPAHAAPLPPLGRKARFPFARLILREQFGKGTLPQWIFVTPNIVNDGHDTTIEFAASFLEYWLLSLLTDPRVNDAETLIVVTFDENETHSIQNIKDLNQYYSHGENRCPTPYGWTSVKVG
ncbi:hypothetical protein B0H16DRAFT_1454981 [Mycena metata]|uniref:Acid phosphatase n=1 Tax=Mycena metata TaxID=1033252 RepID=A0AAD7JFA3_9AGAR|nr:hypothetical protein B0H16DRAFT_1454981 [Mycena metata]